MSENKQWYRWRLYEGTETKASKCIAHGACPDPCAAQDEASHYAFQYAQDHPVVWTVYCGRKLWIRGEITDAAARIVVR